MTRPGNRPRSPVLAPSELGNRVPGALYTDQMVLARNAAVRIEQASTAAALSDQFPASGARLVTASGPITTDDYAILADATGGAIVLTLPGASTGAEFVIKKIDGSPNTVTVDAAGTEQIDGAPNVVLATQNETVRVVADGTLDWYTA